MTYFLVIAFFAGSAIGSFLPVLSFRKRNCIPLTWHSRSVCDFCGQPLDAVALIPVFGYFLLHGKSRCCRRPLPVRYPLFELAFGALFAAITYIVLGGVFGV